MNSQNIQNDFNSIFKRLNLRLLYLFKIKGKSHVFRCNFEQVADTRVTLGFCVSMVLIDLSLFSLIDSTKINLNL